jgi:hypothetical protein
MTMLTCESPALFEIGLEPVTCESAIEVDEALTRWQVADGVCMASDGLLLVVGESMAFPTAKKKEGLSSFSSTTIPLVVARSLD